MSKINVDHMVDQEKGEHILVFKGTGFVCRAANVERTPQGRLYAALYPTMNGNELPIGEISVLDPAARDRYAFSLASVNGSGPDYYKPFLNQVAKILDDEIPRLRTQRKLAPGEVWKRRTSLKDFLSVITEMPEGIAKDLIFPGAITVIAAPSGVGKTVITYALAYILATGGIFRNRKVEPARILLVDFDNPENLIKLRLRDICERTDVDLQVITRNDAPQLLNRQTWEVMPAKDHDVVIVDSFGSATIGVTEKEGAKLEFALETLKTIADKGPAVVVLDNTQKAGASYRGRGEKKERVEVTFEARDVTNWTPSRGDAWWFDIPSANDADWQERAQRKTEQELIRVAFVPGKFRIGREPQPFVLQLDCSQTPWALSDVTQEIEDAGNQVSQAEKDAHQRKMVAAANRLATEVSARAEADDPIGKREAENFLRTENDLTRKVAQNILSSFDADVFPQEGLWRFESIPGAKGNKIGVFPVNEKIGGQNDSNRNPNKNNNLDNPYFAHPLNTGRGKIGVENGIENLGVTEPGILPAQKTLPTGDTPCRHPHTAMVGDDLTCRDCGAAIY